VGSNPTGSTMILEKAIRVERRYWVVNRSPERLLRLALMLFVLGIATAVLMPSFFAPNAEGATTNKTVQGVVYDQFSDGLLGADVTVEIWGGYWPEQTVLRTSQSTVTDSSGYYEVTINSNFWDPHNTISVTVVYGSDQTTRSVEADGAQYQTVDVSINLTIPELGAAGMVIVTMATVCVFVALRRALVSTRRE